MTDSTEKSESPKSNVTELPAELRDRKQLGADDCFSFSCHEGLACFRTCCGNVNIVLTPIDILRLSRHLQLTTREFLDRHTLMPVTKDLKLPGVFLQMEENDGKSCPFLTESGCGVYENRPWSCRMYPLAVGYPPARAGVVPKPVYFLFEDDFCHGRQERAEWTIREWMKNQGVNEKQELEDGFTALVSHPWFIGGRQLDAKRLEMFFTACYDLDNFRRFVFESSFLERFVLEKDFIKQLQDDDEALLAFAFRWLRYALFAEPTMTARDSAPKPGRNS